MTKEISFIHAADLHLDSPFKGLLKVPDPIFQEMLESTFKALDNLVATAIKREVDFVLLVGDLFDNERQSLKAQIKLREAFERLQKHQINVYLSYGNHDYMKGNVHPITYPSNVFCFASESISHFIFEKNNQPIAAIYGFSYENQAVMDNKAIEYKKITKDLPFHIATLHGSIATNTEHDHYAPFQLKDLLQDSYDYWALGHIHKREILKENPFVVYPGNIQGRNRKEVGSKGCYHVTLTETGGEITFEPLHAIEFQTLTMDVSNCQTIHQIEQAITEEVGKHQRVSHPKMINLVLTSHSKQLLEWKKDHLLMDIIEIINERFIQQQNWSYIYRYEVPRIDTNPTLLGDGEHFIHELTQRFESESIVPYISELKKHKEARRFVENFSEQEMEDIKKEAYDLLIDELLGR